MRSEDDRSFEAAWRAFAREDRQVPPLPSLEARVMQRVRGGRRIRRSRAGRRWWMGAAAVIGLTLITASWSGGLSPAPSQPHATLSAVGVGIAAPFKVAIDAAPAGVRQSVAPPRLPAIDRAVLAELPPALMSLGAGPLGDAEPLQLVRLRLPRETLQALGVVLLEPDAGGLVDIDVLVGEDGLARDIRQVRTGQE
jgi:hypothetical protein